MLGALQQGLWTKRRCAENTVNFNDCDLWNIPRCVYPDQVAPSGAIRRLPRGNKEVKAHAVTQQLTNDAAGLRPRHFSL